MNASLSAGLTGSLPLPDYDELLWRFRAVFWEADPVSWQFYYVSEYAELLFGYPRRRWLEERDFWIQVLHPEDREYAVCYCREATRQGRDHCFDYRIVAADGRTVWVRDIVRVEREGFSNVPKRLYGIFVDITEQKELELQHQRDKFKLESILGEFPGVVWTTDTELRFTTSRGKALGRPHLRPDQVVGHTLYEYFATADDKFLPIAMHRRALSGETVSYDFRWQGRVYHTVLQPERQGERIVGVLGYALDVTEQRAETQLLRQKILAEKRLMALVKRSERAMRNISQPVSRCEQYERAVRALVEIFGCQSAAVLGYAWQQVRVLSQAGAPVNWDSEWLELAWQKRRRRSVVIRWPGHDKGALVLIRLGRGLPLFLAAAHPAWQCLHPCIRRLLLMLPHFLSILPDESSPPSQVAAVAEQERTQDDINQQRQRDCQDKPGQGSGDPGTDAICGG